MKSKSDRELLEQAANAAGYQFDFPINDRRMHLSPPVVGLWVEQDGECAHTRWDPLESSSDAFDLAARLFIDVHHRAVNDRVFATWGGRTVGESAASDRSAAARRAIVRAAAAMAQESSE